MSSRLAPLPSARTPARSAAWSQVKAGRPSRRYATAGLNYIFKSLDLIPDGIDDIGFCDDAFVIRVEPRRSHVQKSRPPRKASWAASRTTRS